MYQFLSTESCQLLPTVALFEIFHMKTESTDGYARSIVCEGRLVFQNTSLLLWTGAKELNDVIRSV